MLVTVPIDDVIALLLASTFSTSLFEIVGLTCTFILIRVGLLILHEVAHALVALLCGVRVTQFRVEWCSGTVSWRSDCGVRASVPIFIAAAGPASTCAAAYVNLFVPVHGPIDFAVPLLGLWTASPIGGSGGDWHSVYFNLAAGASPDAIMASDDAEDA